MPSPAFRPGEVQRDRSQILCGALDTAASLALPHARRPEGFLDQGLALPWDETVRWSDPRAVTGFGKRVAPS